MNQGDAVETGWDGNLAEACWDKALGLGNTVWDKALVVSLFWGKAGESFKPVGKTS